MLKEIPWTNSIENACQFLPWQMQLVRWEMEISCLLKAMLSPAEMDVNQLEKNITALTGVEKMMERAYVSFDSLNKKRWEVIEQIGSNTWSEIYTDVSGALGLKSLHFAIWMLLTWPHWAFVIQLQVLSRMKDTGALNVDLVLGQSWFRGKMNWIGLI